MITRSPEFAKKNMLHVVFHTIAWQYFPESVQKACEIALLKAGAKATKTKPLALLSIEADKKRRVRLCVCGCGRRKR